MKDKVMRKFAGLLVAAATLHVFAVSNVAQAAIEFGFDPSGSSNYSSGVTSLDWLPSSALSKGGLTAIQNFYNGSGSTTFTTYTHGRLGNPVGDDGPVPVPAFGQITFIAAVTETVTGITFNPDGTVDITFAYSSGGDNWFEIYSSPTGATSNLEGTGFNNGTLIMKGQATAFVEAGYTQNSTIDDLDKVGTNNFPSIDTYTGGGSTTINGVIDFIDPLYFSGLTEGMTVSLFSTQQVNPFGQVNPSKRFYLAEGNVDVAPPVLDGAGKLDQSSIGTLNGGFTYNPITDTITVLSPDIQYQTDSTMSFDVVEAGVPEPLSVMVWGGLLLVGGALVARNRVA